MVPLRHVATLRRHDVAAATAMPAAMPRHAGYITTYLPFRRCHCRLMPLQLR